MSSPGIPPPPRIIGPAVAIGIAANFIVPGGDDPNGPAGEVGSVAWVALVDRLRDLVPSPPVVLGREPGGGAGGEICAV